MQKILFSIFLIPVFVQAQQMNFNTSMGVGIGKRSSYKQLMMYRSLSLLYEHAFSRTFSVNTGLSMYTSQFNSVDIGGAYYEKNLYLSLPATTNTSLSLTKYTVIFLELGLSLNYYIENKKVYADMPGTKKITKNNGISLGAIGNIGTRTMITHKHMIDFALGSQSDFANWYRANNQYFKMNSISLRIGYCRLI